MTELMALAYAPEEELAEQFEDRPFARPDSVRGSASIIRDVPTARVQQAVKDFS